MSGVVMVSAERGAAAACVRVLTRASRAGVLVPELVPALLRRLANNERAQVMFIRSSTDYAIVRAGHSA